MFGNTHKHHNQIIYQLHSNNVSDITAREHSSQFVIQVITRESEISLPCILHQHHMAICT